jgi:hypothetical protein
MWNKRKRGERLNWLPTIIVIETWTGQRNKQGLGRRKRLKTKLNGKDNNMEVGMDEFAYAVGIRLLIYFGVPTLIFWWYQERRKK